MNSEEIQHKIKNYIQRCQDCTLFVYAFGPEWEDLAYYADFVKAYERLEKQKQKSDKNRDFEKVIVSYKNVDGEFKEVDVWFINHKNEITVQSHTEKYGF